MVAPAAGGIKYWNSDAKLVRPGHDPDGHGRGEAGGAPRGTPPEHHYSGSALMRYSERSTSLGSAFPKAFLKIGTMAPLR